MESESLLKESSKKRRIGFTGKKSEHGRLNIS
jgi:hypothetical protein